MEKSLTAYSHGAGCGCKLSAAELAQIMAPLAGHQAYAAPELVVGVDTSDDAGVWRLSNGEYLLQTVDFFTPIVDDPFDWGRIAAANALSDVYAMGGRPITALQLVAWPRNGPSFGVLQEVLRGGAEVMAASGTTIVGGHSIDDPEPKYGFAVTGLASFPVTNAGARPGDQLVLTKPLGSGIITTAIKRGQCPPELAAESVAVMTELNEPAVQPMLAAGATAATDVTGFGLLGHLREMLVASDVGAILEIASIPTIGNLDELLAGGNYPGGSQRNLESARAFLNAAGVPEESLKILADAQTSGGLLIAIPPPGLASMLDALPRARRIGEISAGAPSITFR